MKIEDIAREQRETEHALKQLARGGALKNTPFDTSISLGDEKLSEYIAQLLAAIRKENEFMRKITTRKDGHAFLGQQAGKLEIPIPYRETAIREALNFMFAYGKLTGIMDSPFVSDVQLYSDHTAFVIENGERREMTDIVMTYSEMFDFVQKILAGTSYKFDLINSHTDAILPDGSRLHVRGGGSAWTVRDEHDHIVPKDCLVMTIRKPLWNFTLEQLAEKHMFDASALLYLEWMQRLTESFIVGGGVGSGKTTLMAAMLGKLIGPQVNCIIEEMPEMQPLSRWTARLYNRPSNESGKGSITIVDNLVDTLRMMYDNVYVGETRTEEVAYWLMQVALTVSGQTATTTHATDGADTVIRRIVSLAQGSTQRPSAAAIGDTFCSTFRHVVVARRTFRGKRITEIASVLPFDHSRHAIPYVTVAKWNAQSDNWDFHGVPEEMIERAENVGQNIHTLPVMPAADRNVRYVQL